MSVKGLQPSKNSLSSSERVRGNVIQLEVKGQRERDISCFVFFLSGMVGNRKTKPKEEQEKKNEAQNGGRAPKKQRMKNRHHENCG